MHLPFADHMHDFDAAENNARTPEALETHHRTDYAFDGTVILLDDVVQVLVLSDLDRGGPLGIERFECRQIGAALVHGNRFGLAILK